MPAQLFLAREREPEPEDDARDREPLEALRDRLRLPLLLLPLLRLLVRPRVLPLSSSSSSPSPSSLSLAPWSTPLVRSLAVFSLRSSKNSGSVWALPTCVRSIRFTASAKRRYVSTLATTIRASTVSSSMPTSDTRR